MKKEEAIPWELLLDADPSMDAVQRYLNGSDIFVAVLHEQTVGVLVLYPVDATTIEIKNIAVTTSLQGKGIGKLLLQEAAIQAGIKGARLLTIGTGNSSIGQLYLYQKCGFELSAVRYNFFVDNYPGPIIENGIHCKHMIMLTKPLA